MTDGAASTGWFGRHPTATMVILTLALLVPGDYLLGTVTNKLPLGAVRDAHFHHGLLPDMDERVPWGGGNVSYRRVTNSLGLRDAARRDVPLKGAQRRILFIGDSFTEGVGLDYEQTFVGRIAAALAPRGIEVLNAGVQSYSPKLEYLKVKDLVERLGLTFDEIELYVDVSDVQDEIMYQPFVPGFTRDHIVHRSADWLTKHSLIARTMLNSLRGSFSQSVQRSFGNDGLQERALWTVDDAVWNRYGQRGMALAQANIALLADSAKARGIALRLWVYPWPEQILRNDLESRQVTLWRAFAVQHALPFTSLFADFVKPDAQAQIHRYFINDDSHWNEAGHALIARRWLEERGYVPPTAAR